MSKGALIFAHNNTEIDYVKIACINALMIQKNLNIPVSLITDNSTYDWSISSLGRRFLDKCFDNIIVKERDYVYNNKNIRLYRDTVFSTKPLPFYNCDHWMAYDLSPYEETLFIDADYFVLSDNLNHVWGSNQEILINYKYNAIGSKDLFTIDHIDDLSIKTYWATCIYFKKTEFSEHVFVTVKHIFENYNYYRQVYQISRTLFRNDFAFSIAIHMMNGFVDHNLVKELPNPVIHKLLDAGDIHAVNGINDFTVLAYDNNESDYTLMRLKNLDLHVMNKWAIIRNSDQLIEEYS